MARFLLAGVLALWAATPGVTASSPRANCESLMQLVVPNTRITEAVVVPTSPANSGIRVPHCRVSGVIDAEIHFAELLPDEWNGRFFAGGQGGFAGVVANSAQTSVNLGYATVGTDTGHTSRPGSAPDASWALGRPDRIENYGHRAIHRTTEVAKAVIKGFYGREAEYSYFFGCSNGGREALMEAQRYPQDFNGIVSCAPSYDVTRILASFLRNIQALYPDSKKLDAPTVSQETLKLVESRVLQSCDAADGVKDGVLTDPRDCKFDLATLPIPKAELSVLQTIYSPTTIGGRTIYPGQPFGGEAQANGWPAWITGPNERVMTDSAGKVPSLQFGFATDGFKYMTAGRADWDYATYPLASQPSDVQSLASVLNADSDDLSAFKARGGKLILAHGWADPALNPLSTIAYYERLKARDAGVTAYARLFMMPGVLHCGGGNGPDTVDWFRPIADWVERGRAPDWLLAQKVTQGRVVNARPLCVYPARAVYKGTGDTNDAASYSCGTK